MSNAIAKLHFGAHQTRAITRRLRPTAELTGCMLALALAAILVVFELRDHGVN